MEIMKVSKRDMSIKAKKLRQQGLVPGNVYGGNLQETVLIQMDQNEASRLVAKNRIGSRLTLMLDEKKLPVQIKDKDVDSQTGTLRNVSFQALAADQKVNSVITLMIKNFEKVAGMREFMLTEIPYAALPCDMIDVLEIDMEGMKAGTVVTVADIPELNSDKLEIQVDKDEIILRITDPKHTAPAEDAAEAVE